MQSRPDYKWQKWRKFVSTKVSDITLTLLYMSQPALLYVTAETLVNRLMWQISTATLLLNPVILHQRGMKNLFPAIVKMVRWKARKNEREIGKDGHAVWIVTWASSQIHIKQTCTSHMEIWSTKCSQTTLFQNMTRKKKCCHFSSFAAEPFFDTGTRFKTHCLFVSMSPASRHCFEPYFTLTGIIDTYANGANSPRQHHFLWHQRQKVDLVGWLVRVQRNALAHVRALKCSRVQQSLSASHSTCK